MSGLNSKKDNQEDSGGHINGMSLGINLAAGVALFSIGGIALDRKRGGGVAFTLTGIFCGLTYMAYEVWKFTQDTQEESSNNETK